MNRRYGITLIFALVFCVAFGQTYCGTVVENDGLRPLANVSVSLLAQDSILVAFVYTNDKGEFCISPPPYRPAAFLSASYIGFTTLQIPISEYFDGICFELKQSDVALKEVKVNANRIRWEGDTLIYNVAGFKTPQDRTVRDVLTKIPGIGVSENGDVSYQGEKINVFYIEGLDLLGDKYKLASNNMQANYVKEIQVLENHVPIKSLVGKTFSEHIAVDGRYNTLQTIYPGWIASNYRHLATGETIFQSFVSDSYTLSASYRNPVTSFFFRLSASYNFNHYNFIMQNEFIYQLTSMSHVLKYKHTQPGHIYMLNAAKSLATWNTRLFVDATYSQMQSSQILNKIFTTYDNQNISISGRIFVQPLRWFNSQYEMQTSLSRFGVINPLANVYPAMAHVSHKLNTYFVAGKSWQIGVNHNVFHGDAMPEASYFLDATAIFKWNGKEFSLLVYNVFNNDTWGYAAYQTFSEYQTQYALVGRYVLARFSFAL